MFKPDLTDPVERVASLRILDDPVEDYFQNLKKVFRVEGNLMASKKSNKSQYTAYDFLRDFQLCFFEKFKIKYPLVNKEKMFMMIKSKILDYFIEQGFGTAKAKDFLIWAFSNLRKNELQPHFLPYKLGEYVIQKAGTPGFEMKGLKKDKEVIKLLEQQAWEYYGCGMFDYRFSKEEYFVGLWWREKNSDPKELKDILDWQKKKFPADVVERLTKWSVDFENEKKNGFNPKASFYAAEAKKNKITIEEVYEKYGVKM